MLLLLNNTKDGVRNKKSPSFIFEDKNIEV